MIESTDFTTTQLSASQVRALEDAQREIVGAAERVFARYAVRASLPGRERRELSDMLFGDL